jgi:hypothetical protein
MTFRVSLFQPYKKVLKRDSMIKIITGGALNNKIK